MQETISITNFGGMMTNPHKEDIPDNMGVYAYNLDPQAELGTLKGIKQSGASYIANSAAIPDVYEADWIKYERSNITLNVDDATNANPIEITTTTNHNLVSGDKVVIAGVAGNTAANGTWRITVTAVNKFTIPVAGNGAYSAGADTATYVGGTKWDLVYIDTNGNDITVIEDFYNTETEYRTLLDLLTTGIAPRCLKTFNNQTHIGNGTDDEMRTIHRLLTNKVFFNNGETISAGLQLEFGACYNPSSGDGSIEVTTAAENDAAGGYFQAGIYYKWAVSLIYDGLQESNLSGGLSDVTAAPINGAANYYDLTIIADEMYTTGGGDVGYLDARVTGVNVYRAESSDGQAANLGLFRLVDTIDINDGWGANNWTSGGTNYTITFRDNGSYTAGGSTYEEETGMPETLTRQSIRYAINEVGGGYHWVTNGVPEGQSGDWARYLFRSKKFRPNMFDWARDFLVLPEIPNALAWYNDRLYAFSDNVVYRINPELMYIEDTFFGAGASHRQSVLVSEYGLYFCNLNGAYRIQDSGIDVISDPIAETPTTGSYIGWKGFASDTAGSNFDRIVIKAEVDKRLVLFVGATQTQASTCLGFYIPTGQWYRFSLGLITLAADSGLFSGKDGEVYISNATASYRLFAGSNIETSFIWVSKEFHLGEPSQNKSWNMIKWDETTGSGYAIAVTYGYDGADPSNSATNGGVIPVLQPTHVYKKSYQIKITGTMTSSSTSAKIDSIDIIVRRLLGRR